MTFSIAAIVFAAIFLALLILLHFLKPELDPSWRMISEYEIGRFGWMMRLAFFSWGASTLCLAVAIWPWLNTGGGVIGRWWLVLIAVAQIGAGIFKTDPITDLTNSTENNLHRTCGAIVIFTFPIAATLAANCLLKNGAWTAVRGQLIFATALIWIGLIAYFASIIIARIKDPLAGQGGSRIYQGWPNRFMIVTYVIWTLIVAVNALHL